MMNEETREAIVAYRLENAHRTLNEIPTFSGCSTSEAMLLTVYCIHKH